MIKVTTTTRTRKINLGPQVMTALKAIGAKYLLLQRERVSAGAIPGGGSFKKYSQKYGDAKFRAGRIDWLNLSGGMFRAQRVRVSPISASRWQLFVGFSGMYPRSYLGRSSSDRKKGKQGMKARFVVKTGKPVSAAKVAAGNNRLRPFIGITSQDWVQMKKSFAFRLK